MGRARGNASTDSDYDLLVVVDGEMNRARKDQIRQAIFPIELETMENLSSGKHAGVRSLFHRHFIKTGKVGTLTAVIEHRLKQEE